ncbi:YciI family protein [Ramlibacter algicola]|uniref:YCII-related domain-containing protein n=1 Tax=Ramlibacter algicola TaxID=2795217 RepID=A0A934Q1W2_9BURK|nr:hypothetical protein [Ramlibacter algicola]MBK0394504.1 hypothetical protein [Ramlibacter algicola]
MQDTRFVVLHRPGPRWDAAKSMFEQDGVREHVAHWRQWLDRGKLLAGGPFLDGFAAGMMVPQPGVDEASLRAHAESDPAVRSGLLSVELHRWMVGMKA